MYLKDLIRVFCTAEEDLSSENIFLSFSILYGTSGLFEIWQLLNIYGAILFPKVDKMTEYVIELYEKHARTPYSRFKMVLPNRARPTYTEKAECFDGVLNEVPRAEIRYAKNNILVAVTYTDIYGKKRLRWKKM